jgi:hypothetical protein
MQFSPFIKMVKIMLTIPSFIHEDKHIVVKKDVRQQKLRAEVNSQLAMLLTCSEGVGVDRIPIKSMKLDSELVADPSEPSTIEQSL